MRKIKINKINYRIQIKKKNYNHDGRGLFYDWKIGQSPFLSPGTFLVIDFIKVMCLNLVLTNELICTCTYSSYRPKLL